MVKLKLKFNSCGAVGGIEIVKLQKARGPQVRKLNGIVVPRVVHKWLDAMRDAGTCVVHLGEARVFFRRKSVGERNYLQIVESRRTDRAVRQHVVATLGRAEDWLETGKLDQLLQSGARLSETALVLSAVRDGDGLVVDSRRIRAPLISSVCGARPVAKRSSRHCSQIAGSNSRSSGRSSRSASSAKFGNGQP